MFYLKKNDIFDMGIPSFRSSFSQLDGNDCSVQESDGPSTPSMWQSENDETTVAGGSRKESSALPTDPDLDDSGKSLHVYRHPRPLERARLRFMTRTGKRPREMTTTTETTTETGPASTRSSSRGRVEKMLQIFP